MNESALGSRNIGTILLGYERKGTYADGAMGFSFLREILSLLTPMVAEVKRGDR